MKINYNCMHQIHVLDLFNNISENICNNYKKNIFSIYKSNNYKKE